MACFLPGAGPCAFERTPELRTVRLSVRNNGWGEFVHEDVPHQRNGQLEGLPGDSDMVRVSVVHAPPLTSDVVHMHRGHRLVGSHPGPVLGDFLLQPGRGLTDVPVRYPLRALA